VATERPGAPIEGGMSHALDRLVRVLEAGCMVLAATALCAIMLITVVDVMLRYVFDAPFSWSYTVVSQYLMVAAFFLSLSYTFREGGHMTLEIVMRRVRNPMVRNVVSAFGHAVAFILVAGILYAGVGRTWSAWVNAEVLPGVLPFPTWLSDVFVPVGCFVFELRLVYRVAREISAAIHGTPYVPLSPAPASSAGGAK
jgi:TRAP-type C4-dicarboxylate transport system permease small subunit